MYTNVKTCFSLPDADGGGLHARRLHQSWLCVASNHSQYVVGDKKGSYVYDYGTCEVICKPDLSAQNIQDMN